MAYAKNKKRLSIDLDDDVYRSLEEKINNIKITSLTKGFFINQCIKNIAQLDKRIADELCLFCYKQYRKHAKISFELPDDAIQKQEDEDKIASQYEQLAFMFGDFSPYKRKYIDGVLDMARYDLKDGYAIIPSDWIPINSDDAKNCSYLVVLAINNKGDLEIPNFCYFTRESDLSYSDKQLFLLEVRRRCPDFKIAEENKWTPIYGIEDENGNRQLLNPEEYSKKPDIGIFSIPDAGDPLENYAYSAMIFRKEA